MRKVAFSCLRNMMLLCALLAGISANGQVVTEISLDGVYIGDRNSTVSLSNPFASYNRYSYGQMLFTSDELTPMTITGITLYMSSENTTTTPYNITIYLGEVTRSSFSVMPDDYVPLSSMTQVYSGTGTYPMSGSLTIYFDTAFYYSGQANLVLAVDLNQDLAQQLHRFQGYNTTKYMPYWRQNSDIDPASPPMSAFYSGNQVYFNLRFVGDTRHCPVPTGIGSEQDELTSLRVFWEGDSSCMGYQVEYGLQGFTRGQGTMLSTTNSSVVLSGVVPGASYEVYVRSICGYDDTSQWSEPYLVTIDNDLTPRVTVEAIRQYGDAFHNGFVEARYTRNSYCRGGYYAWVAPVSEVVTARNIRQLGTYLTVDTAYIWSDLTPGSFVLYSLPVDTGAAITTDTVLVPSYDDYSFIVGDTLADTGSIQYPYCNFYKYSWVQMIYPAELLHGDGEITQIAFKVREDHASSFPIRDFSIYMGHTTMTEHTSGTSWLPNSELTRVYLGSGTIGSNAGWETVVLDDPFVYDGTSNLVIVVGKYAYSFNDTLQYSSFIPADGGNNYPTIVRASDQDGSYAYYPSTTPRSGVRYHYLPLLKITKDSAFSCPWVDEGTMALTHSSDSLLLSWGSAGPNTLDYDVMYGPSGNCNLFTGVNSSLISNIYDTVTLIPGLSGGEKIDFSVVATCDGTSSNITYFNNRCIPIYKLPFMEDFESQITQGPDSRILNDCWEGHSWGANGCYNQLCATNTNQVLLSDRSVLSLPQIDDAFNINRLSLSFDVESPDSTIDLRVGVMSDCMDFTTFVPMDTITQASPTRRTVHFASYHGDGRNIVFFAGSNCLLYLDNIELTSTEYTISLSSNDTALGEAWMANMDDGSDEEFQEGSFVAGTRLLLTAYPAENALFSGWSDGDATNPRELTVMADSTLVALFTPVESIRSCQGELVCDIYPNPSDGDVFIKIQGISGPVKVEVIDIQGRVIAAQSATSPHTLMVEQLAQGTYFVRILTDTAVHTQKIVVR